MQIQLEPLFFSFIQAYSLIWMLYPRVISCSKSRVSEPEQPIFEESKWEDLGISDKYFFSTGDNSSFIFVGVCSFFAHHNGFSNYQQDLG